MQGQVEKSMMTFVTMNTKKARRSAFSGSKERDLNICTFMGFPVRAEITMQKKQTMNRTIAPNATARAMKETKVSVDTLSGWLCCEKKSPKNIISERPVQRRNQPTKNMMILVTINTRKAGIATNMVSTERVLNFLAIYGSPKRSMESAMRMRQRMNRAAATRVTIRETEETEASITGPPLCYVRLKYGYRKYIRMVIYAAMDRNIAVEMREQLMCILLLLLLEKQDKNSRCREITRSTCCLLVSTTCR